MPAPGQYDVNLKAVFKDYGCIRFGGGSRKPMINERLAKSIPGPFAYTPSTSYSLKAAPKYGFGGNSAQRPVSATTNLLVPGPGHYPVKGFPQKGKGGVIG